MKKMIFAAALLLAASPGFAQNQNLRVSATGTGQTTSHIANLQIFNPTTEPQTFTLPPSFIPSEGRYQSYIVPGITTATVPPGATANIPVHGYCTDIHLPPIPSGISMPAIPTWAGSEQSPHAAALLEAFNNISTAFDQLKNEGAITTQFGGNPEKEREAVIQQSFWIHTAAESGKPYKKADFYDNTVRQFEASTGVAFEKSDRKTRENVQAGVDQFWTTFEAVGVRAKKLSDNPELSGGSGTTVLASVRDLNCECGNVKFDAELKVRSKVDGKVTNATINFDGGISASSKSDKKVKPGDVVEVTVKNLVPTCTQCAEGPCEPKSAKVLVSATGLAEYTEKGKPKADKQIEGRTIYEPPAGTVEALDGKSKAKDNPVRFFIIIKYNCENGKCVTKACEKVFEIVLERE